jgi:hypothetical protein
LRASRPSPRKSSKKKTDTEPVTGEGDDVDPSKSEEEPPRRLTRAARSQKAKTIGKRTVKRRLKQEKYQESESEDESDFDSTGSGEEQPRQKLRGARKAIILECLPLLQNTKSANSQRLPRHKICRLFTRCRLVKHL